MSFRHEKFESYDDESKGKLRKVIRSLLIALTILLGLALLSIALTGAGYFPGNIIGRFVVSSYLDGKYEDYDIISYDGYNSETKSFIYSCDVNGAECKMEVYNFKVSRDGYYHEFGRNKYFEEIVGNYLNSMLDEKWIAGEYGYDAQWFSEIEIPLSDASYPSFREQNDSYEYKDSDSGASVSETKSAYEELIQSALRSYGGSLNFTLDISGESISMDTHKSLVYNAVHILQQEMYNRPRMLQVNYYRSGGVLQYESTVRTFQFNYNESGIKTASDIHRYAEVPPELKTKVNIYYTVKFIFIVFLSATVISLCILWLVRKIKRQRGKASSGTGGRGGAESSGGTEKEHKE